MKITNLDGTLKNELGEEMTDGSTVRKVLTTACTANIAPQLLQEDFDTKFKLGMIAVKLGRAKKNLVLTSEEIGKLKPRLSMLFSPMICLRVNDVLEGKANAENRIPSDEVDVEDEKAE